MSTCWPSPAPVAVPQRQQDAVHRVEPGEVVGNRHPDPRRRAVRMPRHVHQAALGLDDGIVPGQVPLRAGLSVAGDRAVDEARVAGRDRVVAEAQLRQAARPEVLDQHVRRVDQTAEHVGAGVGLQIDGEALLAAVQAEKEGAPPVPERRPGAGVVALGRLLDLDDLGAHVAEHHRAVGTGEDARQVEHPESGQGGHRIGGLYPPDSPPRAPPRLPPCRAGERGRRVAAGAPAAPRVWCSRPVSRRV